MRIILFFDLPTLTTEDRRNYRKFVKLLKENGFYSMQESVFLRMAIDNRAAESVLAKIRSKIPKEGNIAALTITEKQFNSIEFMLGENFSEVICSDERYIEL